jgi:hypothetical protein
LDRSGDPDIAREVHQSLLNTFERKVPHVPTSRWFGLFDSLSQIVESWHSRLVVLLYLCISMDWVPAATWRTGEGMAAKLQAVQGEEPKLQTNQEKEEVRQMRLQCGGLRCAAWRSGRVREAMLGLAAGLAALCVGGWEGSETV